MIRSGHVTGVSVRWEPLRFTRAGPLPKEHYAHVKEDDADYRKRAGFFHENWRVLEGSVVAIQADKAAMIGRAEETEGIVSDFWRAMAEDAKDREAIEARMDELPLVPSSAEVTTESEPPSDSTPVEAPAEDPSRADTDKLLKLLAAVLETNSSLQDRIAALEQSRVEGAPAPPVKTVQDIFDQFETRLSESADKTLVAVQAAIDARRGKVTPTQTYRQKIQAEGEALVRQALAEEGAATTDAKVEALSLKIDGLIAAWREKQPAPEVKADECRQLGAVSPDEKMKRVQSAINAQLENIAHALQERILEAVLAAA